MRGTEAIRAGYASPYRAVRGNRKGTARKMHVAGGTDFGRARGGSARPAAGRGKVGWYEDLRGLGDEEPGDARLVRFEIRALDGRAC
jgi:hypothetical protein